MHDFLLYPEGFAGLMDRIIRVCGLTPDNSGAPFGLQGLAAPASVGA
jgi:hypothetical protein